MPTKINYESAPLKKVTLFTDEQKQQGKDALTGAVKGAALGAKIGTIVPGIGNVVGAAAGGLIGGIGSLIKGKNQQEDPEQNTYTTNIYPMKEEEKPLNMKEENKDMPMMMGPLKQLSPYTASYSAYNMSAKQASMEPKMQMLSGVSSLQFTDEGLEKLSAANIGGKFGAIVEAEKNKRDEKSPATMKPPVADKTRVERPIVNTGTKLVDIDKSQLSDLAGYRSGDARNMEMISTNIKKHMKQNKNN